MLQYSRFDVGGDYVYGSAQGEQLQAQLFSDRGLYRPGDTAVLAAIVKRDDWTSLGNLPLVLQGKSLTIEITTLVILGIVPLVILPFIALKSLNSRDL